MLRVDPKPVAMMRYSYWYNKANGSSPTYQYVIDPLQPVRQNAVGELRCAIGTDDYYCDGQL